MSKNNSRPGCLVIYHPHPDIGHAISTLFAERLSGLRVIAASNVNDVLYLFSQYKPLLMWSDTHVDAEQIQRFRILKAVCPTLRFVGFTSDDVASTRSLLGWDKEDLLYCGLIPWAQLSALLSSWGMMTKTQEDQPEKAVKPVKLTRRMKQLLFMLQEGMRNHDIAQKLDLSEHTIKVHFWRLYKRLGVNNRLQAVHKAQLLGLIEKR